MSQYSPRDDSELTLHTTPQSAKASVQFGTPLKTGYGFADSHHGELFQGVIQVQNHCLHHGLVSLPCAIFHSKATFHPDQTSVIKVKPSWKFKALRAANLTVASTGPVEKENRGGTLQIESDIPVGWGLGSSTSDVVATIRAVADTFGRILQPEQIAKLAVRAETASDAIMFSDSLVIFSQREGLVIEDFGATAPAMEVIGFNTDMSGKGVQTLDASPMHYEGWEIEAFSTLVRLLRRAIRTQDLTLVGRVAHASARINQRYVPTAHFAVIERIAEEVKAVGLQVAHSGSVAGLLFDPADRRIKERVRQARRLLAKIGFHEPWHFRVSDNQHPAREEYE